MVDEENALEVIDLVLQDPRQQTRRVEPAPFAGEVRVSDADVPWPPEIQKETGKREAAFLEADDDAAAVLDHWIDQHERRRVPDSRIAADKEPPRVPHLRRREADAAGGQHRPLHAGRQRADVLARSHVATSPPQARIAVQQDGRIRGRFDGGVRQDQAFFCSTAPIACLAISTLTLSLMNATTRSSCTSLTVANSPPVVTMRSPLRKAAIIACF